jgi:hypothetical protein
MASGFSKENVTILKITNKMPLSTGADLPQMLEASRMKGRRRG